MHTVFSEEMFLLAYTSIIEGKVQFVLFGFVCSRRVLVILSSSCAEAILPYPLWKSVCTGCVQAPLHPALKFYLTTFLGGRREPNPASCPLDYTCATYVAYMHMNRKIHILHTKLTTNAVLVF